MIDFRRSTNIYRGFYIHRSNGKKLTHVDVGKNGTSNHKRFYKKDYEDMDTLKFEIMSWVRKCENKYINRRR